MLLGYILRKKTSLKLVKPYKWLPGILRIVQVGVGAGINPLSVIVITFSNYFDRVFTCFFEERQIITYTSYTVLSIITDKNYFL